MSFESYRMRVLALDGLANILGLYEGASYERRLELAESVTRFGAQLAAAERLRVEEGGE